MTIEYFVAKAGGLLAIIFGVRIVAKWRVDRKERAALATPLVDAVLLEAAFAPRTADNDDADVLVEVRNTFLHLNRRAYAEEFWRLHEQLTAWHNQLPNASQRGTFRRALIRLLQTDDRWLQLVAAKTCAALGFQEAVPILDALVNRGEPSPAPPDSTAITTVVAVEARFREELMAALAELEPNAAESNR